MTTTKKSAPGQQPSTEGHARKGEAEKGFAAARAERGKQAAEDSSCTRDSGYGEGYGSGLLCGGVALLG